MPLTVSNTLSGEDEVFEPLDPDHVTLYYCGLTVSDDAHLGHARSWVHTDVMHRWLEHSGYDVTHVENFTDINEKIVARVGDVGPDERAVAETYIGRVIEDMRRLNLKRVDVHPRVSEHIDEIIAMTQRLIERGHAYESNGSVYFDVTSFPTYGALSNQSVDEMEAQEEGALDEKRNPQDFALWKADGVAPTTIDEHRTEDGTLSSEEAASRAVTYDSPWGEGRPGWHIECSAMATTHLGDTFDIHVAGRDIQFPHNENEIAQAVAATDGEFARYWLHTGLLRTEGEKMSSSLQNFFRVRDAVPEYGVDVIRTFFLSTIYDADQTFSEEALAEAEERWTRLSEAYRRAVDVADSPDARTDVADAELRESTLVTRERFTTAMNDDFNTREALAALSAFAGDVNTHVAERDVYDYQALTDAIELFERYGGEVFGLTFGDEPTSDVGLSDALIDLLLDIRENEREAGRYDQADAIRDDLEALGVVVEDDADETTYRITRG